jgi:hypothetical protein
VRVQIRDDLQSLPADERPLVLPDHHRVEPAVRPQHLSKQFGRARPLMPRKAARVADVEELDGDATVAAGQ